MINIPTIREFESLENRVRKLEAAQSETSDCTGEDAGNRMRSDSGDPCGSGDDDFDFAIRELGELVDEYRNAKVYHSRRKSSWKANEFDFKSCGVEDAIEVLEKIKAKSKTKK